MTREEYEEIANAYAMAYQDYSGMMRKTAPESWRVEAAMNELEELRLLMKQYEVEHPEECQNPGADHDTEQADQEFLKELESMDGPDVGSSQRPDPVEFDVQAGQGTIMSHDHEWVVYSTAMKERWLMLQCVECGTMATVDDPTKEDWRRAFHAPSKPYRWTDEERVHVRQEPPCPLCVVRTEKGAPVCSCLQKAPGDEQREYERLPAEIIQPGEPLTEEEVADLEQLAELVSKSDLCSRLFPLFVQSYQDHTGHEPTGVVKRIAARIEQIDRMGLHCAPQVVARVLREYIGVSSRS